MITDENVVELGKIGDDGRTRLKQAAGWEAIRQAIPAGAEESREEQKSPEEDVDFRSDKI